ncbi:MAG: DNA polymerase III subunit beta [Minisyncoccia bacterium]
MNISIEKKILSEAVAQVIRFSEKRQSTLATLAGIAVVADTSGIFLRATNLETGINLKIEGQVKGEGTLVLPAHTFREITASFSGSGAVVIEGEGDTAKVRVEGTGTTLKTLPYEDFPSIAMPEEGKISLSLPGVILRSLITSTAPYASTSTVRPELASVLFLAEGGVVKMVATDSFRLAEKKTSVKETIKPFSLLIPAKNALDIAQTLPDSDVQITADDHQCAFSFGKGIAVTRLTNATYPDYTSIIPKKFSAEAQVLRKDIEAALRRAAIFSDQFQKVRLGFDGVKKKVTLAARNSDVGEIGETIPASLSGEALELSFNHRYLSAPLSTLTQESISLSAAGIGRPLIIRGQGDSSFLYLVMPMNQ